MHCYQVDWCFGDRSLQIALLNRLRGRHTVIGGTIDSCIMTQLVYCIAQTALYREMTKLETKLDEVNKDLDKFKDVGLSVHDHGSLVVIPKTHKDMLQRKMTICIVKLKQLHTDIAHVAHKIPRISEGI